MSGEKVALVHQNIGHNYWGLGRYDLALESYLASQAAGHSRPDEIQQNILEMQDKLGY